MIYYFDNAATTQMEPSLTETWRKYSCEEYFNPSALSDHSTSVYKSIEDARKKVAASLGADADEIYFTSGGTEADNLAVSGVAGSKKGNIITSKVEHPAVYNTIKNLKNKGFEIRYVKLDEEGAADGQSLASLIDENTLLVSLMHVNNETGAINDIQKLASLTKKINKNSLFMSDGVQAYGKLPVKLHSTVVDLYTISGHKVHAPKGIGALYVKKGVKIAPVFWGGGQERNLRSGTENVANIVCLGEIADKIPHADKNSCVDFKVLKNTILGIVDNSIDDYLNLSKRGIDSLLFLFFKGIKSEVLMRLLENEGFIVGNGSACSSKNKTSRIADALGVSKSFAEGGIRISFGKYNTPEEAEKLGKAIVRSILFLRGAK